MSVPSGLAQAKTGAESKRCVCMRSTPVDTSRTRTYPSAQAAITHVVALVLDATARISLVDLVVPFQTSYGQLAIGLGTISLDLVVIVIVTTWLRRALSNSWWQWMHRLSYVGFVTMFLHAILSGTDLASPVIAGLSWAAAIAIGYYSLERAGRSLAVAKARA